MSDSYRYQIRLTSELRHRMLMAARRRGDTLAAWIRRAIWEQLEREESHGS